MANNLYNTQVTPKGYKRGGGVKKPGKVKSFFGKIRKKIAPTFGEQFGQMLKNLERKLLNLLEMIRLKVN